MSGIIWFEPLGVLAWPLTLCSVLVMMLILERLFFFIGLRSCSLKQQHNILKLVETNHWSLLDEQLCSIPQQASTGIKLLVQLRDNTDNVREESVAIWLSEQRNKIQAHLGWLTLLATVSPLLGLLGTVLGMIEAFRDLAAHTGPVSPSVLANGLQQAMLTTAFGLCVAIPALIAAHTFHFWGRHYLDSLTLFINKVNLAGKGNPMSMPTSWTAIKKPEKTTSHYSIIGER